MKKSNKKIIIAAVVLMAVIAVLAGLYFFTRPDTQAGSKTIGVTVVHKDGTKKEFTYHTDAEYLAQALLAEGLISGDEGEFGLYVSTIDGETADFDADQSWWCLTKDGGEWMTGVSQTVIADGEHYEWTYTIGMG